MTRNSMADGQVASEKPFDAGVNGTVRLSQFQRIAACPDCQSPKVRFGDQSWCCSRCGADGPVVDHRPVMLPRAQSVFQVEDIVGRSGASPIMRPSGDGWRRRAKSLLCHGPAPKRARTMCAEFLDRVRRTDADTCPVVLIVGGGSRGIGTEPLYAATDVERVGLDVYASTDVSVIGDAHGLPVASGSVDGIWCQYVLEHVLDPQAVVGEMARVLRPNGVVYSEVPFLQHIHEEPYDFFRFTPRAHRWLFRQFEEASSGIVMDQGHQLLWTIDHAVRGFTRSAVLGKLAKAACWPVAWAGFLASGLSNYESASSSYFLGQLASSTMSQKEILAWRPVNA